MLTTQRAQVIYLAAFCAILKGLASVAIASPQGDALEGFLKGIHWLGHDSFRIEAGGKVIYIDPWQIKEGPKADLILITHDHFDHCSPEDVAKIRGEKTKILAPKAAASKLPQPVSVVKPGDTMNVEGVNVRAVPAYNVNKFRSPGVPFHPKEAGHVGYLFTVAGTTVYHAGDSDYIPEMASIKADIALLPVSGTYVMTAEEAAKAADEIRPRLAIPMHVGRGIGTLQDRETFKTKTSVPVRILPME
jgi:L-ascorbate metabolism protein UlaG (beta-lactamase superfamily)